MSEYPSFHDFYTAVHGRTPFPWQNRLAGRAAVADWPAEVGVPTGLGKTSVIDIAVWALACQADRPPLERTAPTRIWYVVNRRLLVDAGFAHADLLAGVLRKAAQEDDPGPIGQVARGLASIGAATFEGGPLAVVTMRGGIPTLRPPDPSVPAVISSTVPMFGSRLLFRGYGTSRSMAPVDAALAGIDALVLLDEAHLSGPLMRLIERIPESDAHRAGVLRAPGTRVVSTGPESLLPADRSHARLVSLTATGSSNDRFDLDEADHSNPVVARRLGAAKPTRLVEASRSIPEALATSVIEQLADIGRNAAAVVFTNRPSTSLETAARLLKTAVDADVMVITGRFREPDADQVRRSLLDSDVGAPSGRPLERARSLIVVATQTLEVGADLDFDILVTETAGARALTQRFGRLNRLGERPWASAVIAHESNSRDSTLYGDEPNQIWVRLHSAPADLDLGPARIAEILGKPSEAGPYAPELLGSHLWEYAKTWPPPPGEAPPQVFFDGIGETFPTVSVVWRVAARPGRLWVVPAAAESVEIPLGEARVAFAERPVCMVREDKTGTPVLEEVDPSEIRPGTTLVIDVAEGLYGARGWDPTATETVLDLSPLLSRSILLTPAHLANLLGRTLAAEEAALVAAGTLGEDDEPDEELDQTWATTLLQFLAAQPRPANAPERLWGFSSAQTPKVERRGSQLDPWLTWSLPAAVHQIRVEADDDLSNIERTELYEHNGAVGRRAGRIAEHLGLPPELVAAIASAGRYHDLGKADPRFQTWLGAAQGGLLAKGPSTKGRWERGRIAAQWPRGGRHELLSLQAMEAAIAAGLAVPEFDLVAHLVVSHHGRGRPFPGIADGPPMRTSVEVDGMTVSFEADPSLVRWDHPARFRDLSERFGHWGLALLESIVRLADHSESSITEVY